MQMAIKTYFHMAFSAQTPEVFRLRAVFAMEC